MDRNHPKWKMCKKDAEASGFFPIAEISCLEALEIGIRESFELFFKKYNCEYLFATKTLFIKRFVMTIKCCFCKVQQKMESLESL